jgi:hypothetical protein
MDPCEQHKLNGDFFRRASYFNILEGTKNIETADKSVHSYSKLIELGVPSYEAYNICVKTFNPRENDDNDHNDHNEEEEKEELEDKINRVVNDRLNDVDTKLKEHVFYRVVVPHFILTCIAVGIKYVLN